MVRSRLDFLHLGELSAARALGSCVGGGLGSGDGQAGLG